MTTLFRTTILAAFGAASLLASSAALAQSHLRIGLAEDPDALDPTTARTYVGRIVFTALCDKLFDIDDKLAVVPQLATGYTTSDDGKTVTIKLRPGVKFHDGTELNAEAAKYSLERHLNFPGSFRKAEISVIDKVETIDPLTIRLNLKAPFAPLISQLTDRAGIIVSPKAAEAAGANFGANPVCAGPYKFVERIAQDRIALERFADYWNKDQVKIDRITFLPLTDSTVRLANLQSGGVDLIERLAVTDAPTVKGNAKLRLATVTELGYQGLTMNVANGERAKTPLGQNAKVRQALELAIDRDILNQVVFNGEYVPDNQWVAPTNPYYQKDFPTPKRDVAKAKALLKEAGVSTPLTLTLMTGPNPENKQVSEIIQSMAKDAGFDIKIQVTEFATALNLAEKGDFELFLLAWSGRTDPDGNIYSFASCKGPLNYGKYCSEETDDLLNRARTSSDADARKKIYHDVARKALTEGGIIYLYHRKLFFAHTERLEGFRAYPDGMVRPVGLRLK